ncbi:MAG: hypothetical protein OXG44_10495, partial [Gammaproteobacteria bacterium]|nr:hypothetical protein [Gammaproteobacteria bacterium]
RVNSGGGSISSTGVYTPANVSENTQVEIALLVDGEQVDTSTFNVTPLTTPPSISNKITRLPENQTHAFGITNASNAEGDLSWRVRSGGGTISSSGVYSPPNITTAVTVVIELRDGTTVIDTDTFTVTVVPTGTISGSAANLPENSSRVFSATGVTGGSLRWWATTGTFSTSTGASTRYTPPNVSSNTSVRVELRVGGVTVDSVTFTVTAVSTTPVVPSPPSGISASKANSEVTWSFTRGALASSTFYEIQRLDGGTWSTYVASRSTTGTSIVWTYSQLGDSGTFRIRMRSLRSGATSAWVTGGQVTIP